MSDSHAKRDWQVFESLYMGLSGHFSRLFSKKSEQKVIEQIKGKPIKLVDASIMSVCLELIRRNISKTCHCFGHFVTLIRVRLTQYNRLGYIASEIQITVQKAKRCYKLPDRGQQQLKFG